MDSTSAIATILTHLAIVVVPILIGLIGIKLLQFWINA